MKLLPDSPATRALARASSTHTEFVEDSLPLSSKSLPDATRWPSMEKSALSKAGLAACPSDAVNEVKDAVHLVSARPGGHGAARELIELLLKTKGLWSKALEHVGVLGA